MAKLLIVGKIYLFLVFALVATNAIQFGRCPFVRPQTDVDPANLVGLWYEYAKYPILSETLAKCIKYRIEELSSTALSVERTVTGVLTEAQIGATGVAYLSSPGVFIADADGLAGVLGNTTVSILGTDNTNYAVLFSCDELLGLGIVHDRHAFALTREPKPSAAVVRELQGVLRSNGLSVKNLVQVDQLHCPSSA